LLLNERVEISLPDWARKELQEFASREYKTDEEMMV